VISTTRVGLWRPTPSARWLLFVVVDLLAHGAGSTTTGRGEAAYGASPSALGAYYASRRFRRSRLRTAVLALRLFGHRPANQRLRTRSIDQAHKPDEFANEEQVVACLESPRRLAEDPSR
jgi:hypothetical protein